MLTAGTMQEMTTTRGRLLVHLSQRLPPTSLLSLVRGVYWERQVVICHCRSRLKLNRDAAQPLNAQSEL